MTEGKISYEGVKYGTVSSGATVPEIVAISCKRERDGKIFKRPAVVTFLDPSVEGLIGLGTVRGDPEADAPRVIYWRSWD